MGRKKLEGTVELSESNSAEMLREYTLRAQSVFTLKKMYIYLLCVRMCVSLLCVSPEFLYVRARACAHACAGGGVVSVLNSSE